MALDASIVEVPKPPAGRLPFLRLLARLVSNPVASWGQDFYNEPIVVYRDFGLESVFVTDPELNQQILLDDSDAFTKSPLYDNVLGRAGGKGLLIAEGDDWRWQRRIAAPLFRAEAILSYAPAFAAACEPVLTRWREAAPGTLQIIGKDMTDAAMQALQDTILGADLGKQERKIVSEAGTAFLSSTTWKIAYASLKLPSWTPHPGGNTMRRAGDNLREVAGRVLANRRQGRGDGADLLARLVAARDQGSGAKMSDSLIIDNVVTFLMVGQETTAQALTWALYVLALFPEWQDKVRDEVRRVIGAGPLSARQLEQLGLLEAVFMEAMRLYPPAPSLMRITRRPIKLGAVELASGATVVIPIYVVHRHRLLWSDPLRFDPSRFAPEARAGRHRCAYMPFSTGPEELYRRSFLHARDQGHARHLPCQGPI